MSKKKRGRLPFLGDRRAFELWAGLETVLTVRSRLPSYLRVGNALRVRKNGKADEGSRKKVAKEKDEGRRY